MNRLNLGKDLYIKGRIGWKGLSKSEYLEKSDYRIINATALEDGFIDWNNCGFISKERYEESKEIQLKENDILISKDGTIGKIGYVKNLPGKCTVASGVFVVRNTKEKILNFDYLYHILKSNIFKNFINNNKAMGSTINHLYQRDLDNFVLELPEREEQNRIATVLNTLDKLVDTNNKFISNSIEFTKLLYNYWFVQYNYPKRFPKELIWNKNLKMKVPNNFEYTEIKNIEKNIITGKTPSTKHSEYFGGNIQFITIDDIRGNLFIYKTKRTLTESGLLTQTKKTIPENSICVSCIGTPGIIGITTEKCTTNQQINSIVCEKEYNIYFLYHALSNYFNLSNAVKMGNIFSNMNKDDFSNIKVLYNEEIAKHYASVVKPYFDNMKVKYYENSKIKNFKEFLLPLLMNGKVTINE